MSYVFHSDGGHGWLAVKRNELEKLEILNKISHYSHQKGGTVYLEEDDDAMIFIEAKFKTPEEYDEFKRTLKTSETNHSPIRNYKSFEI